MPGIYQPTLNDWTQKWKEERETTYSTTLNQTDHMLYSFLTWFDKIYWIRGNHDERIARKTGGEVTVEQLFRHVPVEISQYTYMYQYLPSRKEWVYIAHPTNYSKNSVGLAQQIYNVTSAPNNYNDEGEKVDDPRHKNKSKCHIVVGHTHQAQSGFSPDANYECHGLGCMRDPSRTKYTNISTSKHHQWQQGFMMIRGGKFIHVYFQESPPPFDRPTPPAPHAHSRTPETALVVESDCTGAIARAGSFLPGRGTVPAIIHLGYCSLCRS